MRVQNKSYVAPAALSRAFTATVEWLKDHTTPSGTAWNPLARGMFAGFLIMIPVYIWVLVR